MTALLENPEQDFLGTVYHNLGLSKSQAGQFFTPYNVGQMMARINMPDSLVLDNEQAAAESQVILDKISELFEKDGDSK